MSKACLFFTSSQEVKRESVPEDSDEVHVVDYNYKLS